MVLGSLLYVLFIAQLWQPMNWLLYSSSALLGIGAALIWTAQVYSLILN